MKWSYDQQPFKLHSTQLKALTQGTRMIWRRSKYRYPDLAARQRLAPIIAPLRQKLQCTIIDRAYLFSTNSTAISVPSQICKQKDFSTTLARNHVANVFISLKLETAALMTTSFQPSFSTTDTTSKLWQQHTNKQKPTRTCTWDIREHTVKYPHRKHCARFHGLSQHPFGTRETAVVI